MSFFCLEGIDGAGKTTLRRLLAHRLQACGWPVVELGQHSWLVPTVARTIIQAREGGGGLSSAEISRSYFLDKVFHASENISPAIESAVVLSDRYIFSDAAYQEALHSSLAELILNKHRQSGTLLPNIIFYIDVPVEVSQARIQKRNKPTKHYERPADLSRVNEVYQRIFIKSPLPWLPRVVRVDSAQRPPQDLVECCLLPAVMETMLRMDRRIKV
jgi:dTMP kinase